MCTFVEIQRFSFLNAMKINGTYLVRVWGAEAAVVV